MFANYIIKNDEDINTTREKIEKLCKNTAPTARSQLLSNTIKQDGKIIFSPQWYIETATDKWKAFLLIADKLSYLTGKRKIPVLAWLVKKHHWEEALTEAELSATRDPEYKNKILLFANTIADNIPQDAILDEQTRKSLTKEWKLQNPAKPKRPKPKAESDVTVHQARDEKSGERSSERVKKIVFLKSFPVAEAVDLSAIETKDNSNNNATDSSSEAITPLDVKKGDGVEALLAVALEPSPKKQKISQENFLNNSQETEQKIMEEVQFNHGTWKRTATKPTRGPFSTIFLKDPNITYTIGGEIRGIFGLESIMHQSGVGCTVVLKYPTPSLHASDSDSVFTPDSDREFSSDSDSTFTPDSDYTPDSPTNRR